MKLLAKQKETHRLREWTYGCWVEGMVGEFGMDMYTLLYLKWITNKNLRHSTRNSAQMLCGSLDGRGFGICMVESLRCFTWNYHNILNWLYTNTKKTFLKKKAGIIESNQPRFASEVWCLLSVRYWLKHPTEPWFPSWK